MENSFINILKTYRKLFLSVGAVLLLLLFTSFFVGCERIDAGHEGIKINLYGTGKGVQDAILVTGTVIYNKFTEVVVEYPTYVQTVDYDAFTVNAKDGSIFTVDPSINFKPITGQTPAIYTKYRQPLSQLKTGVILTFVKDAFKNKFNNYTTDEILSRRAEFDDQVTSLLKDELQQEGFTLEQMTFGMTYPPSIQQAIEAKANATQITLQKQAELAQAKADAEILLTRSKAESEANRLRTQSLTPQLIQLEFIKKWDGRTPLYGSAPTLFKNVE